MNEEKPRILIVDDIPAIVQSLKTVLEYQNYSVDTAYSGSDALRKIQNKLYDVVISDIEMPGMTGLDFLERVRKDGQTQEVILMTGYLETDYFIRAIRLGASDFISKPIETQQLIRSIKTILEKNSSREGLDQLMRRLDRAELTFVIDPGKFIQYGVTKVCDHFLKQNLKLQQEALNELLICVDEMIYNAFIHGTLALTLQQRNYEHSVLQRLIAEKLAQPEINVKRIRFTLTLDHMQEHVMLEVKDDGDGFDFEYWQRILAEERVLNLEGSGRGLAMLYHLSDKLDFAEGGRKVQIIRKIGTGQIFGE